MLWQGLIGKDSTRPLSQLKIQLISGYSDGRHLVESVDDNYPPRLSKPIKAEKLLFRIRSLLNDADSDPLEYGESVMTTNDHSNHPAGWDYRSMTSGFDSIDREHMALYVCLSEISEYVDEKGSRIKLTEMFDKFMALVVSHLQNEQATLQASQYANVGKVEKLHQFQEQQAFRKFGDFKKTLLCAEQLHQFFSEWLLDHVMSFDQQALLIPEF